MSLPRRFSVRDQIKKALVSCAAVLVAFLALIELGIRLGWYFVPDRGGAWDPGAEVRILCVGDSHTWGASVERSESYPGRLEAVLQERAPGTYGVMNLGVPGMNTSQLRNRVPEWIARYDPDVIIVWAGVNKEWNVAEADDDNFGLLDRLDQVALTSRLYRWFKVWNHARGLERYQPKSREDRSSRR